MQLKYLLTSTSVVAGDVVMSVVGGVVTGDGMGVANTGDEIAVKVDVEGAIVVADIMMMTLLEIGASIITLLVGTGGSLLVTDTASVETESIGPSTSVMDVTWITSLLEVDVVGMICIELEETDVDITTD